MLRKTSGSFALLDIPGLGTTKHALRICGIPELLLYQDFWGNLSIKGLFNPIYAYMQIYTVFFDKLKSRIWLSHTQSIKHRSKFGLSYIAIA